MKFIGKIAVLLVLSMLLMPFCPMSVSAAGASASTHNCHGEKQAPSGKVLRSCCDDAAVPVTVFQPQPIVATGLFASIAEPAILTLEQHQALTQESPPQDTGARLAQLSLLRI
jgi:hypothetical protein